MKKKFNDYSITPQHLGKVIRDNNITRKRTTRRHYPETRYGKSINLKKEFYIHCASGYRSVIAASILKAKGIENVVDIKGGFQSIKQTNLGVQTGTCN